MLGILMLLLQPGSLDTDSHGQCDENSCNSNSVCHSTCVGGEWLNMTGFPVTQSSVSYDGFPEKAIDGNRDNNFEHGKSCSHTKRHTNHPSWTVTLPTRKHIAVVKVTDRFERRDRRRLNGFSIHIIDTVNGLSTRCASKVQIGNGETKPVVCNAVGNKIRITAREYLVLCEVEVFVVPMEMSLDQVDGCTFWTPGQSDGEYLSISEQRVLETETFQVCRCLQGWSGKDCTERTCDENTCNANSKCQFICTGGKWLNMKDYPVSQSSVAFNGFPKKAVDGNRNNNYERGHSCTHTKRQTMTFPSWTVTLPTHQHIAVVKVTDRLEKEDRGRLNGFSIHVLGTGEGVSTRCAHNIQINNGETKAVACNAVGNKIKITGQEYLVLCEVEVFVVPLQTSLKTLQGCAYHTLGAPDGEYISINDKLVYETETFRACRCLPGWQGIDCNTRNSCLNTVEMQCSGNRECRQDPTTGIHRCICAPGWSGEGCDICEDESACYECFDGSNPLATIPLPQRCFKKLRTGVELSNPCSLGYNTTALREAKRKSPTAGPINYQNVLVLMATYFFDQRMASDWEVWAQQIQKFNEEDRDGSHRKINLVVAYTGLLDNPPKPLYTGRRGLHQDPCRNCSAPPPSVEVRVLKHSDMPKRADWPYFFHNRRVWFHSHYSVPWAVRNILARENRTFSHYWYLDSDMGFMGNFAEFIKFNMDTRGEDFLGSINQARSLEDSYRFYTVPSFTYIKAGWRWGGCPGFDEKDLRGTIPMVTRFTDALLTAFEKNFHRACFVEMFMPSVCATIPGCTIGSVDYSFYGYVCTCGPVFQFDQSGAVEFASMRTDPRLNQSQLYHPFKTHAAWRPFPGGHPDLDNPPIKDKWARMENKNVEAFTSEGVLFFGSGKIHICNRIV